MEWVVTNWGNHNFGMGRGEQPEFLGRVGSEVSLEGE